MLPQPFIDYTRRLFGEERFERYLHSFEEEAPVSIRLNPRKTEGMEVIDGERVAWCDDGYYLKQRPAFTFDPLLHAGCYYVQEAASMFLDEVLRQQLSKSTFSECLDLCAAPGGKSTLLRTVLPDDCVLYSNEPISKRAAVLAENVAKWGGQNHIVTNCYARDYRKAKMQFDLILCDVPCSGEGMFRKDHATIDEWSPQQVEKCWQLQRDIISDIWPCLNEGGLMIYSTCTFNTKENEENIRWMMEELGAEPICLDIPDEWGITGSLLEGFTAPVYRFIPGTTRGEGLFMCVMRKGLNPNPSPRGEGNFGGEGSKKSLRNKAFLNVITPLTLGRGAGGEAVGETPLTYQQALAFLRHEALTLPEDAPRGIVTVCFDGHPLGQVKNIGTRANNLYPKEWKIKTTHIPNEYEAILRHT